MKKITKEMLKEAYNMGNWNEYLYDLLCDEAVDNIQSAFPDLEVDDIQPLVDAFVAGFHGDNFNKFYKGVK